jgi:nicotinamidase/pyrazinamidase
MKMNNRYKIVGWDVDTQRDFMEGAKDNPVFYEGKLKIDDAMDIASNLEKITNCLWERNVPILGSVDWHSKDAYEFPKEGTEPDFANTFPEHCVQDTYGAEKIDATRPVDPLWIDYAKGLNVDGLISQIVRHNGEVFFRKDRFDVFDENGNPYAKQIVKELGVEKAILYGVALEVCDDFAVMGLRNLGVEVYAVSDAMRALDESVRPQILEKWEKAGAKIVKLDDVLRGNI